MIAGPNGSGKSTLLDYLSERAVADGFPLGFVQNPDALQREIEGSKRLYLGMWGIRPSDEEFSKFVRDHQLFPKVNKRIPRIREHSLIFEETRKLGYLIPILCDFLRQRWISSGESFTFETVMSGADKLQILKLAKNRHYRTYLYYICTDDVSINEARIKNRVKLGGHSVPSDKVNARYERSLRQLGAAIRLVDRAFVFDNSGKGHQMIASFENGQVAELYDDPLPRWFVENALTKRAPRRR